MIQDPAVEQVYEKEDNTKEGISLFTMIFFILLFFFGFIILGIYLYKLIITPI
jgi:hypothetical protein